MRAKADAGFRDFFALHDVSFELVRGDSLGIVGRNGSGKSTLLQILCGTLTPTSGRVSVMGRVSALLELGTGFNPEFTGRENVFLIGSIQGMSRRQMEERFDEIAGFADIGPFLDQPVKTYSSGMIVRLAFAAQTAMQPDVFIVDEALAVGDVPFQVKCFKRIRAILDSGTTVIFVSHDIGSIRTLCRQAMWLHEGRVVEQGPMKPVCDGYERACWRASGMVVTEHGQVPTPSGLSIPAATHPWLEESTDEFQQAASLGRHGDGRVRIHNFFIRNANGDRTRGVRFDEEISLCYVLKVNAPVPPLFQIGVSIKTKQGTSLISVSDRVHDLKLQAEPGCMVFVSLQTTLPLRSGEYYVTTGLFSFKEGSRLPNGVYDFSTAEVLDRLEYAATFEVLPQTNLGIYGPVHAEGKLKLIGQTRPAHHVSPSEA